MGWWVGPHWALSTEWENEQIWENLFIHLSFSVCIHGLDLDCLCCLRCLCSTIILCRRPYNDKIKPMHDAWHEGQTCGMEWDVDDWTRHYEVDTNLTASLQSKPGITSPARMPLCSVHCAGKANKLAGQLVGTSQKMSVHQVQTIEPPRQPVVCL
jgi:hypothetical protein